MPTKPRRHIPKLYWLIHHRVLLEATLEPIAERIEYIKVYKTRSEQPIRLKWMRRVKRPDLLPKSVLVALANLQAKIKNHPVTFGLISFPTLRAKNHLAHVIKRHAAAIARRHRKECPGCPCRYRTKGRRLSGLIFP